MNCILTSLIMTGKGGEPPQNSIPLTG
jgi:hypothetical protein